ncbi:MAG: alpha/beta hydrolase [Acidobacteriaceae bacterium]|nr:alpha/beta hydrolase [Acidobacteriaceae bacterium]
MLPYDEAGSGKPIVLLHAGVGDRTMWREHLEPLADAGFRVLALDLPGFGEAAVTPGAQAPWEDVLRTLKELDLKRTALVGNSFGAAVALRIAAVAPAAVSGLVLISAPPLGADPSPELEAAWEAEEAALERGDIDGAVAAVVKAWTQPDASAQLRERIASMQRRALELQLAAGDTEEAPDPLERDPDALGGVQVPALVAVGEHDMPDFKSAARELGEVLPQARSVVIEGAGHLAPLENPGEFRRLVLDFLGDELAG